MEFSYEGKRMNSGLHLRIIFRDLTLVLSGCTGTLSPVTKRASRRLI